jgi:hypothetical protein
VVSAAGKDKDAECQRRPQSNVDSRLNLHAVVVPT